MRKVNRKKLNNKGFTLVELLAVVVILALVMGIAASSMLNTMNSSRKSTLHSAAQTAASNLNNWIADDMLATTVSEQKLGNDFIKHTQGIAGTSFKNASGSDETVNPGKDQWICLGQDSISNVSNKGTSATLLNVLGLSGDDIVIGTNTPTKSEVDGTYTITDNLTCSALRYNSSTGGYEFLLVAKDGGKYYVASETNNYAFSRASGPNKSIND